MTNIPTDTKEHYNYMRKLNPELPDWDDASPTLRKQHETMFKEFVLPMLKKVDEVVRRGKVQSSG